MVLEDFNRSRAEAANIDVSSKLLECCYPGPPKSTDGDKHTMLCAAESKDAPRPKEAAETPEQRIDRKIKNTFGADVLDHLKDWNWLIDNRDKLEKGFKKAHGQDAWDMAVRMRELSKVDGQSLIYLKKQDGPTHGTLIEKRYDVYLRRGRLRSDNQIGQVYH